MFELLRLTECNFKTLFVHILLATTVDVRHPEEASDTKNQYPTATVFGAFLLRILSG